MYVWKQPEQNPHKILEEKAHSFRIQVVRFWVCQTLVLQATSGKYLPANVGRI